ncbi:GH25 family lysozyme [Bifidobacterium dolichotidis]|nr:GH25 family lysozyme [Bifidobacterium dolichotidis]
MWERGAVEETAQLTNSDDAAVPESANRPDWEDGYRTVRMGNGEIFSNDAMKIIDVSEHQQIIDWNKVKNSDVDGAILRIGFGVDNLDYCFVLNLEGVRSVNLPYGIYHYSYAYDAEFAKNEAESLANMLQEYGVTDNLLPIYYDLEEYKWPDFPAPTTTEEYVAIVNAFTETMEARGYPNVQVYSYTDYFDTRLNDPSIKNRAGWIAHYDSVLAYDFSATEYNGAHGWQYTSTGSVWGINGSVDVSAFDRMIFTDVNSRTTPHFYDIDWAKKKHIINGFDDGSFGGELSIVRQDMAAFLYRVAGSPDYVPTEEDKQRFSDVNEETPHAKEIWWLAANKITTGFGDGTFRPTDTVIRQDMAAFLYRAAGSPQYVPSEPDKQRFRDVNEQTPHAKEIWWLVANRITTGFRDGTFRPMNTVIRQDMAAFLHRTAER